MYFLKIKYPKLFLRPVRSYFKKTIKNIKNLKKEYSLSDAFNSTPGILFTDLLTIPNEKDLKGLFEYKILTQDNELFSMQEKAIENTNKLVKECCNPNRNRKLVQVFDELSDTLCTIADLAEFIRLMHDKFDWRNAANITCTAMNELVEKLNTNRELYDCIKEVQNNGDKFMMTDIEKHVIDLFVFDFELCGIHLPEKERNTVVYYNNCILQYSQNFTAGASRMPTLHKSVVPQPIQNYYDINEDEELTISGYSDIPDEFAREWAYKVFLAKNNEQEHLFDQVLLHRNELAKICGFPTYAHRAIKGSTAETPEFVFDFLNILNSQLSEKVKSDFELLRRIKATESKQSLAMWDIAYYVSKIKQDWLKIDAREYCPYFSLGTCMEGINTVFRSLFKINLVWEKMHKSEFWTPNLHKLAVMHETEGLLGHIYCDFFERFGKANQDCHFTIKGGRKLQDGSYKNPVVVIVLNFPLPTFSCPTLLTPNMVENLFHEMGHAIHSMLGRTEYQHVTGTRCSTDFAEVPSILMEYFASDPRVLTRFARHYKNNNPLPEKMLQNLCISKRICLAAELQAQIFYSVLDLTYHTDSSCVGRTTEVMSEIQSKYYPVSYVENTAWHLRFSHLIGYGAKYYSYLLSRAIASSIWQTFFKSDPFNESMGQMYREQCLAYGGGKPPRILVKDYLNKEITAIELSNSVANEVNLNYEELTTMFKKLS